MHVAVRKNSMVMVDILYHAKASIDSHDEVNMKHRSKCTKHSHLKSKPLLQQDGQTPLEVAKATDHDMLARLLQSLDDEKRQQPSLDDEKRQQVCTCMHKKIHVSWVTMICARLIELDGYESNEHCEHWTQAFTHIIKPSRTFLLQASKHDMRTYLLRTGSRRCFYAIALSNDHFVNTKLTVWETYMHWYGQGDDFPQRFAHVLCFLSRLVVAKSVPIFLQCAHLLYSPKNRVRCRNQWRDVVNPSA